MKYIAQDSYCYWIEAEEYESSGGRIVAGKALSDGARLPPSRSTLEYSYSVAGKLERIVLIREDGSRYTSFAAKSKVSTNELAGRLSERIAARTIEALKELDLGAPLQAVEMSFRSVTNYVPVVIPATERDKVSDVSLVLAIDQKRWINLKEEDFEPEMTEFVERMSVAENWAPGQKCSGKRRSWSPNWRRDR